ncbi:hypothetical protein [Pseudomonas baetica]|uniref:hypothetical protein n=1 Tax=Pseudomonas baetica TaxID=674054 RepID=UPI002404F99E|nr:hypothetical protein [Pseudomonas baetica]MDF9779162.1 hypothetical protein [Pseudomonas baetica]
MNTPIYDPYATLPFHGYRSPGSLQPETYPSLMHFIESEKYRGVDDSYRRYLLTLTDQDDFLFETAGVAQGGRRTDWEAIKVPMIRAGMWMQLVQNQEALANSLLQPGCMSSIQLVTQVAGQTYNRLHKASHEEGEQLRRVVLTGDCSVCDESIYGLFDQIFANRLPDEIYLATEEGVSRLAEQYCIQRYIPARLFSCSGTQVDQAAANALAKGTHVFAISAADQSDSAFAESVLEMAAAAGKPSHRIKWSAQ